MNRKMSLIIVAIVCIAGLGLYGFNHKKTVTDADYIRDNQVKEAGNTNPSKVSETVKVKESQNPTNKFSVLKKASIEKESTSFEIKTNMYNDLPASSLPLSAIAEISTIPDYIKDKVITVAQNNNIYMVQKHNDKLLIVTDNPSNIRHNIEFIQVSLANGQQIKTTLGYNDKMKDSQNDIWEYTKETQQPTRHTKYNADGDVEFVEVWNYEPENPVKYEMKDADGKVVSIRKETLNNGTDLRVEHIVYDKNGQTKMNVSATYEGEDIKRFTYYNADNLKEGGSIYSDYSDGLKTKETVYTPDLKVKNLYTSDYKDGMRNDIIKWDNQNKEVNKYLSEEAL